MFRRVRTVFVAIAALAAVMLMTLPVEAAKPLTKRPHYPAFSAKGRPIRFGYGFAPYVYYETYGFGGIQGAPNASPLQFGYGDPTFGTSGFSFGSSDFGY